MVHRGRNGPAQTCSPLLYKKPLFQVSFCGRGHCPWNWELQGSSPDLSHFTSPLGLQVRMPYFCHCSQSSLQAVTHTNNVPSCSFPKEGIPSPQLPERGSMTKASAAGMNQRKPPTTKRELGKSYPKTFTQTVIHNRTLFYNELLSLYLPGESQNTLISMHNYSIRRNSN